MWNLRRHFYTILQFDEMKMILKKKIGVHYKLGSIDRDEIHLYYLKDFYTENGLDRVPACYVSARRGKEKLGRLEVEFAAANFVIATFALVPFVMMLVVHFSGAPIPGYYALCLYPFLYLILVAYVFGQSDRFQKELEKFEAEIVEGNRINVDDLNQSHSCQ